MAKSTGSVNPAFVNKALGVRNSNPLENDAIGYSTRVLTQASLPHSDPGKQLDVWIRRNGNFCLSIQPHIFVDGQGNRVHVGYPYGVYPRLLKPDNVGILGSAHPLTCFFSTSSRSLRLLKTV